MESPHKIVMISSTARDLPEHRQEALAACLQQGYFPKMMEHLPARDDEAISASLDMVDEADIYIGIFAHRYGYVPAGYEISITEMEYNRAVERGIPRLIFIMHDDHPVLAKDVDTGASAEKLNAFKERLKLERVSNFFSTPADLRAHIINSLSHIHIDQVKQEKQRLFEEARRVEGNNSINRSTCDEVITLLEQIREIDGDDPTIAIEIQRLTEKRAFTNKLSEYFKKLTGRITDVEALFGEISTFLMQRDLAPDSPRLHIIDTFLQEQLSAADFCRSWQALAEKPTRPVNDEPNYRALIDRIKRGEIVFFLGPEIACLYQSPCHDTIVRTLAEQADYPGFSGSLAALSEYYNIQADYGRSSLVSNLQGLIHRNQTKIPLYENLSRISQPLVLISATYDTFLEDAFQKAGKKYVLLSSVFQSTIDHEIGSILLYYSDGKPAEKFSTTEPLSGLDLLKNGYSLIYEVRGFLDSIEAESGNRGCNEGALAISESNYFNFARYVDKLIPEYLIRQLAGRGLFFLGFTPRQWDDRLIIDAILDKRHQHRQNEPPSCISPPEEDKFQKAYWESRSVRRYELALLDFLNKLQTHW